MKYSHILALDPSGNFDEGKGCTGYCIINAINASIEVTGCINATNFESAHAYYRAHTELIKTLTKKCKRMVIVIEDYILYGSKATNQINSRFETPKLIGILQYYCDSHKIPYEMQLASLVKQRWANNILTHKGFIKKAGQSFYVNNNPINRHTIDAIRHGVHYMVFKN